MPRLARTGAGAISPEGEVEKYPASLEDNLNISTKLIIFLPISVPPSQVICELKTTL
jgi:hypothetical protein